MAIADNKLEISSTSDKSETRIRVRGRLDGSISPGDRALAIATVKPGCRLVVDLEEMTSISAVGLRMLLQLSRAVRSVGGSIRAANVPESLLEMASAAGFLRVLNQPAPPSLVEDFAPSRLRVDAYPTHEYAGYGLRAGRPLPFGATAVAGGINFSVFSRNATECILTLYPVGGATPLVEIPFPPEFRIGDVFAMTVFNLDIETIDYGFRMDGPSDGTHRNRFDRSKVLLDPAARAVANRWKWGARHDGLALAQHVPEDFDWENDRPLELPIESLVIYELHVRGFTRSPSSGVKHPGTFAGLIEKIPYLQELGVNCVELLPVFEFDETENQRRNPRTGEPLFNYWGYSTLAFLAPKAAFAASGPLGMQVDEFKYLVKELHRAGIEVMLDVVFNHTSEGNEDGPTQSFRGIDNQTYYMLTPDGHYLNFSGCGNTLNCNHPAVRGFVVDCLRHWVSEYHIDGFRFDLASILGRGQNGEPLSNPPLLESLAGDPVLGRTKLIAEAWDAGGLYQVGTFPAFGRWAEWNGRYRDCLRKFLKGDAGLVGEMATRMMGSPDLYWQRTRSASVNFVTCHDGFTLADLVSYNEKHNEDNGEENRDGANDNNSWNCGAEGPTEQGDVNALRRRQMENALAMLLLSRGVPMLLMGDEVGRTQQGNNNAYCHDSPMNWFDWSLVESNAELLRFCRLLIQLRHGQTAFTAPLDRIEVSWHGVRPWQADWSPESRLLAFLRRVHGEEPQPGVFIAMNMHWNGVNVEPPPPALGARWHVMLNTGMASPEDIWEPRQGPPLADQRSLFFGPRSVVALFEKSD